MEAMKDYHVIVAGAGAVLQEKFTPAVLDKLGPASKRIIFDRDIDRVLDEETRIRASNRLVANGFLVPFSGIQVRDCIGLITTPEHLEVIRQLSGAGVKKFIVEKPIVSSLEEIDQLRQLLSLKSDLKVYPLDFYVQKAAPLLVLTGAIKPEDLRCSWVVMGDGSPVPPEMFGNLENLIGKIEGVYTIVYEGGGFGLPDLAKRPWLENDNLRGGMLLDLGTHALTPLIAAGVIPLSEVDVVTAERLLSERIVIPTLRRNQIGRRCMPKLI